MQFGIQHRPTTAGPDLRELGRALEDSPFDALFFPEHTHMPVEPGPAPVDDELWLRVNSALYDPFIALTAVAAVTERLLLGTGICLAAQHDVIVLAKVVATLDQLSGGRVILGVGAGWNTPELRHHRVNPARRVTALRETVAALRAIWSNDVAEFHGEHVDFGPLRQWPKPAQPGGPPILLGGEGPRVLDFTLQFADGWLPNEHDELLPRLAELRERAAALGRVPPPVTVYADRADAATIERLAAAGVARCVFTIPNNRATPELFWPTLREYAELARRYV